MNLAAIVATDKNGVIGLNNQIPWHLPADLQYFKKMTTGKIVVMGKNTFLSIGKALPNRRNLVLTTDLAFQADNVFVFHSIDLLLNALKNSMDEVMIIGGAKIYQQLLPHCQTIYLTLIDYHFTGDTYFPAIDLKEWHEVNRKSHTKDDKNPYNYHYITYKKITGNTCVA